MIDVISYTKAIQISGEAKKRYLLLGNGFSTSLYPKIFSYRSLLEEADFKKKPKLRKVFDHLGTTDFEHVIRALEDSATILGCYGIDAKNQDLISKDASDLKNILVKTISARHPKKVNELTESQIMACSQFLQPFRKIYTLNYDVLLYWVLLSNLENPEVEIDDGFRLPDDDFGADYRVFDSPHSPTYFYLHGGLHLYDAGADTRKYVWKDVGKPIMEQVKEAMEQGLFPLFVSEGTSKQKLTKINHSDYLAKGRRSFEEVCKGGGDLFIFGHSLAENDDHFLDKIRKGKIRRVFVSAYKDKKNGYDKTFLSKAKALSRLRVARYPLEVHLFDADSANVWGAHND